MSPLQAACVITVAVLFAALALAADAAVLAHRRTARVNAPEGKS